MAISGVASVYVSIGDVIISSRTIRITMADVRGLIMMVGLTMVELKIKTILFWRINVGMVVG